MQLKPSIGVELAFRQLAVLIQSLTLLELSSGICIQKVKSMGQLIWTDAQFRSSVSWHRDYYLRQGRKPAGSIKRT